MASRRIVSVADSNAALLMLYAPVKGQADSAVVDDTLTTVPPPDFFSNEYIKDLTTRIGPIEFTEIVFSIESRVVASKGDGTLIPAQLILY